MIFMDFVSEEPESTKNNLAGTENTSLFFWQKGSYNKKLYDTTEKQIYTNKQASTLFFNTYSTLHKMYCAK